MKKSMRGGPTTPEREEISEKLVHLVLTAQPGLQREIDLASPANEFVLLILDGTSPLAGFAPPHIREGGTKAVAAKSLRRADLIRSIEKVYPILAEQLKTPAKCGHLEYLASVAGGGVIECTACDLGLKPTPPSKRAS